MTELTRRSTLLGATATALLPLAGASPAQAAAPQSGKQAPGWYRYKVGTIEVTVATDGAGTNPLSPTYVVNATKDEVNAALAANHLPPDKVTHPYTPIVVNTGSKLVVIDTGLAPERPDVDGLDAVPALDSTSILALETLPRHLMVVGGGYVGVEYAQMFRRFGSEVTLVENGPHLLGDEDEDIAEAVTEVLRGELYGISPLDPATYAGVALLLAVAAMAATYLPARRAARLDPTQALRE